MNKSIKKLNILLTSVILCFGFTVTAFAEETVKYYARAIARVFLLVLLTDGKVCGKMFL